MCFYACFTLIRSWEGKKTIQGRDFFEYKLVRVGLQETNNFFYDLSQISHQQHKVNEEELTYQHRPFQRLFRAAGQWIQCGHTAGQTQPSTLLADTGGHRSSSLSLTTVGPAEGQDL